MRNAKRVKLINNLLNHLGLQRIKHKPVTAKCRQAVHWRALLIKLDFELSCAILSGITYLIAWDYKETNTNV